MVFKAPQSDSKRCKNWRYDCMDNYEKPSQWCARKQEEALEGGDQEAALNYFQMFQLWKSRGI